MKINKKIIAITILISSVTLGGCSNEYSGSSYGGSETLSAQKVNYGTIKSIKKVQIRGTENNLNVGSVSGSVLGALAGSQIGGGFGRVAGGVGGALLGGVTGNVIQKGITNQEGINITVKLDNGETFAITQLFDPSFSVGQRVQILGIGNKMRVSH